MLPLAFKDPEIQAFVDLLNYVVCVCSVHKNVSICTVYVNRQ